MKFEGWRMVAMTVSLLLCFSANWLLFSGKLGTAILEECLFLQAALLWLIVMADTMFMAKKACPWQALECPVHGGSVMDCPIPKPEFVVGTIPVIAGEDLKPGDPVAFNEDGRVFRVKSPKESNQ